MNIVMEHSTKTDIDETTAVITPVLNNSPEHNNNKLNMHGYKLCIIVCLTVVHVFWRHC